MSKDTPLAGVHAVADTASASTGGKLIALTFDDGPRPYVLFGSKATHPTPGLVDILDQNGVKATLFSSHPDPEATRLLDEMSAEAAGPLVQIETGTLEESRA